MAQALDINAMTIEGAIIVRHDIAAAHQASFALILEDAERVP
jgi:hypothetical protein